MRSKPDEQNGREASVTHIPILPNEKWYGGAAADGIHQPYTETTDAVLALAPNATPNQCMPLLLSTAGRWLWNDGPFQIVFRDGIIQCPRAAALGRTGGGLREAYREAMRRYFPFDGSLPDERLFSGPVYNTWIEFTFDQTQEHVLDYAEQLLANGFLPGVLMIDDGWTDCYGRWSFAASKFSAPRAMLARLHEMGFAVMLWVCPFVTPDAAEYRALAQKGLLVRRADGAPHIANWWNGWSACLDMTNPDACRWLQAQLDRLTELGADGFKFDAGDSVYYPDGMGDAQSKAWAAFGRRYPLNEFRAAAHAGGWPLAQRQCDKAHAWDETGLAALIPDAIVQSLTGYPYLCPDMIGGGEYQSFQSKAALDEELVVRWAQLACLMPMMQFSAAPWRVLSPENLRKVQRAAALRRRYQKRILSLLEACGKTGEPVLRPMAYHFDDPQCLACTDQFLLGERILVAPLLQKGATTRAVYLPAGHWRRSDGSLLISQGQTYLFDGDLEPIVLTGENEMR